MYTLNSFIDLTIYYHKNPSNLASSRLLCVWDPVRKTNLSVTAYKSIFKKHRHKCTADELGGGGGNGFLRVLL